MFICSRAWCLGVYVTLGPGTFPHPDVAVTWRGPLLSCAADRSGHLQPGRRLGSERVQMKQCILKHIKPSYSNFPTVGQIKEMSYLEILFGKVLHKGGNRWVTAQWFLTTQQTDSCSGCNWEQRLVCMQEPILFFRLKPGSAVGVKTNNILQLVGV